MDEVLSSIDTELTKCICGNPIPENGVSLDYCSDVCQYRYYAGQSGADAATIRHEAPDTRESHLQRSIRIATGLPPELAAVSTAPSICDVARSIEPDPYGPQPHVMWAAGGSPELARGIDLTPFITSIEINGATYVPGDTNDGSTT